MTKICDLKHWLEGLEIFQVEEGVMVWNLWNFVNYTLRLPWALILPTCPLKKNFQRKSHFQNKDKDWSEAEFIWYYKIDNRVYSSGGHRSKETKRVFLELTLNTKQHRVGRVGGNKKLFHTRSLLEVRTSSRCDWLEKFEIMTKICDLKHWLEGLEIFQVEEGVMVWNLWNFVNYTLRLPWALILPTCPLKKNFQRKSHFQNKDKDWSEAEFIWYYKIDNRVYSSGGHRSKETKRVFLELTHSHLVILR